MEGKDIAVKRPIPRLNFHIAFFFSFVLMPYLVVLGVLISLSSGIHGTVYSSYPDVLYLSFNETENNGSLGSPSGHYSGDVRIDFGTGWIFCNGKVQSVGPYQIKDADFQFSSTGDLTLHGADNGVIQIDGKKGDLVSGLPIAIFSLIAIPFGIIGWAINETVRNRGLAGSYRLAHVSAIASFISGFPVFSGGSYCWFVCAGIFVILAIAWFIIVNKKHKAFSQYVSSNFYSRHAYELPSIYLITGVVLFATMTVYAFFQSGPPYNYDVRTETSKYYFGYCSMIFCSVLIAWGIIGMIRVYLNRKSINA